MSDKDLNNVEGPPGASPGPEADPDYQTVRDRIDSAGATEQLASMLSDESTLSGQLATEDKAVKRLADDKNAPISWIVVVPAFILVIAVVVWGLAFPDNFSNVSTGAFTWVVENLGWAFLLFGTIFVAFVLFIAFSRFGSIRLGEVDEQPEFRTISWIAMMFAAGMGIGLMFFGAAEPLTFYLDAVPNHEEREVGAAMATTMYHWTLHPWAIYAIVGLAIAYSTFRLGRKQLISSAFIPLIGEKNANGWIGKVIDILSIFATIFGTACSLGLGALQIRSGLQASGIMEDPG